MTILRKGLSWIAAGCVSLSMTSAFAQDENPVRNVKPIENSQHKVGEQLHKTADEMKDLLDQTSRNVHEWNFPTAQTSNPIRTDRNRTGPR